MDIHLKCDLNIFEIVDLKIPFADKYHISNIDFHDEMEVYAYLEIYNSGGQEYFKHLNNMSVSNFEEAHKKLNKFYKREITGFGLYYAIKNNVARKTIGYIILDSPLELNGLNEWSMTYCIHKYFRGNGIVSEAISSLLPLLKLHKFKNLNVIIEEDNINSIKLINKLPVFEFIHKGVNLDDEKRKALLMYNLDFDRITEVF